MPHHWCVILCFSWATACQWLYQHQTARAAKGNGIGRETKEQKRRTERQRLWWLSRATGNWTRWRKLNRRNWKRRNHEEVSDFYLRQLVQVTCGQPFCLNCHKIQIRHEICLLSTRECMEIHLHTAVIPTLGPVVCQRAEELLWRALKDGEITKVLIGSLWRRQSQQSFNTLTPFYFLSHSLHVSAPTGHPQERYIIRCF
jgi:hypothetical protein